MTTTLSKNKIYSSEGINYTIEEVHITTICPGDTILHYGELKTVCRNNIKHNEFMGISIFGDSYRSGYLPVKKANIIKA